MDKAEKTGSEACFKSFADRNLTQSEPHSWGDSWGPSAIFQFPKSAVPHPPKALLQGSGRKGPQGGRYCGVLGLYSGRYRATRSVRQALRRWGVCNSFLQGVAEKGVQREGEPSGEWSPLGERHWGWAGNPWPLPKPTAWVLYTWGRCRGRGGLDASKLKARYSEQSKESMGRGRGGSAVSGLFPPSGKSSGRRHSFKGHTESSLPVLVFCAIKKPEKINIT